MDTHEIAKAVAYWLPGFEYVDGARQRDGMGELYACAFLTSTAEVEPIAIAGARAMMRGNVLWTDRPMQLFFSSSHTVRGKLSVSLDAPRVEIAGKGVWLGDALPTASVTARIRMAPTRAPRAMAADIERRLLPFVGEQWARMLAWCADREAYQVEQDGACEQLRAMGACFNDREPNKGWVRAAGEHVSFEVNGTSVRFNHLSLHVGSAVAALGALGTVR